MSSKRDLVEAHSFSRRRLVTAFVSGAPGGREVEPVRPGRAVIGGVAVAVLLVAGAAIAGVIAPRTPSDWLEPGLVIAKESGADYVVLEKGDPLRPLINTTSGQLIFGKAELDPSSVSREEIDKQEVGDAIGIFGAPDSLPTPGQLVGSGWTACTALAGGVHLRIDRSPGARPAPDGAVVVSDTGGDFLVTGSRAGAHRLQLPSDRTSRADLLNAFGNPSTVTAGPAWLNLFPLGDPLDASSFPIRDAGERASYNPDLGSVGDLVTTDNGRTYLIGDSAPVELDGFALAVYREAVRRVEPREISSLGVEATGEFATWPPTPPGPIEGEPCAVLEAEPGSPARAVLGSTTSDSDASASSLGESARASVAPSLGAYVRTAGHGDAEGGQPWVIDSQAKRYRLGGPEGETAAALGYGSHAAPTIPDVWVELFACGPELSRQAATGEPDASTVDACAG